MQDYPAASNGLGRAERFAALKTKPTYLWEVAQKPVSVRVDLHMATRLDRKVRGAVWSLSAQGSEIGGVLLGSVGRGSPAVVTLDDFELIPCDYVRGPLYKLGTQDQERFARCVAERSSAGGLKVVGFFRSHTRPGLALDADDLAFCKAEFSQPHQIALLIGPGAGQMSRAGIFIWEDGSMHSDASYLEFPLSHEELLKKGLVTVVSIDGSRGVPAHETSSGASPAAPVVAPQEPQKRQQIVPLAPLREVSQTPAPSAVRRPEVSQLPAPAAPAQVQKPAATAWLPGGEGLRGRVGRCSIKVQLRPAPRLDAVSKAAPDDGTGEKRFNRAVAE